MSWFAVKFKKWLKVTQLCPTLLRPHGLYSPWNSPGQNTGVGSLSLLHGFFPTQGLNPGLLHCRWILYHLRYQGSQSLKSRLADNISRVILSKFLYWCINVVSTYLWVVRCMWFYSCAFCFLNFYSEQIIFLLYLNTTKNFKKSISLHLYFPLKKETNRGN